MKQIKNKKAQVLIKNVLKMLVSSHPEMVIKALWSKIIFKNKNLL